MTHSLFFLRARRLLSKSTLQSVRTYIRVFYASDPRTGWSSKLQHLDKYKYVTCMHRIRNIYNTYCPIMMTLSQLTWTFVLVAIATLSTSDAFAPKSQMLSVPTFTSSPKGRLDPKLFIYPEKERDALTRDSEPDEFFATWVVFFSLVYLDHCIECVRCLIRTGSLEAFFAIYSLSSFAAVCIDLF